MQHGRGWRARVLLDGAKVTGPLRDEKTAAQADLDRARAADSRDGMKQVLEQLKSKVASDRQSSGTGAEPPAGRRSGAEPPTTTDVSTASVDRQ